jgi:O-antigen ligase
MVPHHNAGRSGHVAQTLASTAALAVPCLALVLPSGYSYGAALMLLSALCFAPRWWGRPVRDSRLLWLVAAFALMALTWQLDAMRSGEFWRGADKPLKYLGASPCLFFVARFPPKPRFLWLGIALGAIGSGSLAAFERWHLHWERPGGYTNAIQFGDLSLMLGLLCLGGLMAALPARRRPWWQALFILGAFGGVVGSVLSLSRGGWLSLVITSGVFMVVLRSRISHKAWVLIGVSVVLVIGALCLLPSGNAVDQRFAEVGQQIRAYRQGNSDTSIGARLDLWKVALTLGVQKPWTGWTDRGFQEQKNQMVKAGQVGPRLLELTHAHNEYLDVFAKRGLIGLFALLLMYAVPIVMFWPPGTMIRPGVADRKDARPGLDNPLALRLIGLCVPVYYMGCELTQGFLIHNSGTMMLAFMLTLIYGCLVYAEQAGGNTPARAT